MMLHTVTNLTGTVTTSRGQVPATCMVITTVDFTTGVPYTGFTVTYRDKRGGQRRATDKIQATFTADKADETYAVVNAA